jgi:hypothetical protein
VIADAAEVGGTPNGNGWVDSSPAGIHCRFLNGQPDSFTACDAYFKTNFASEIAVTISATPDTGNEVSCETAIGTLGACGAGQTTYYATETDIQRFLFDWKQVSVRVDTSPFGRVVSTPSAFSCELPADSCTQSWRYGTAVTLTAQGWPNNEFWYWTGFCAGQDATCAFTLTSSVQTTAWFKAAPSPTSTPSPGTPQPSTTALPTAGPTAKPTAKPGTSFGSGPSAGPLTTRPPGTLAPGSTAGPEASDPGGAPEQSAASRDPGQSTAVADAGNPGQTQGTGSGLPVGAIDRPAAADLTPVIAAILVAGVLVALAIVGGAYLMRGRRRSGPIA